MAVRSATSGADIDVDVIGVFDLPKATGAAWTQGVRIYWDDTAKNCTTTPSTNKLIGVAMAAALSGDTIGRVRLSGAFTL